MAEKLLPTDYVVELSQSSIQSVTSSYVIAEQCIREFGSRIGWKQLELEICYPFGSEEKLALAEVVDPDLDDRADSILFRRSVWTDFLSYKVHTNREIHLMLLGQKPLSVFMGSGDRDEDAHILDPFTKFIDSGQFVYRKMHLHSSATLSGIPMTYHLLSLPGEEDRIHSYMENADNAARDGASADTVRREGALLGYTDAQTEEYLRLRAEHETHARERLDRYLSLPTHWKILPD